MAVLNRRKILYLFACATGWPVAGRAMFLEAGDHTGDRVQAGTVPAPSAIPAGVGMPAERVLGIGGFFFRARDPKALSAWYQHNLGIDPTPTTAEQTSWHTEAGTTVFAPFPMTTKYFGDQSLGWMINFRVRDLEKMAAQLRLAGATVTIDPERYPNGRFGRTHDPEGNPIELWEPAGKDAAGS